MHILNAPDGWQAGGDADKAKKKKTAAKKVVDEWVSAQMGAVAELCEVLKLDLERLWDEDGIEEEFPRYDIGPVDKVMAFHPNTRLLPSFYFLFSLCV